MNTELIILNVTNPIFLLDINVVKLKSDLVIP